MIEQRTPSEMRPARMAPLARLPVFLALEGKRAVVAGGNAAAAWKAELLSAAGASRRGLCRRLLGGTAGRLWVTRRVARSWCTGERGPPAIYRAPPSLSAHLRMTAPPRTFAAAARAAGMPVNVIDMPAFCDFSFGSIVNRSPLVIGISTDGAAPVFAQAIRAKLEALLPNGFALWAQAAARWRVAVKGSGLSFAGRRKFWQLFTAHAVTHPDRAPTEDRLRKLHRRGERAWARRSKMVRSLWSVPGLATRSC